MGFMYLFTQQIPLKCLPCVINSLGTRKFCHRKTDTRTKNTGAFKNSRRHCDWGCGVCKKRKVAENEFIG